MSRTEILLVVVALVLGVVTLAYRSPVRRRNRHPGDAGNAMASLRRMALELTPQRAGMAAPDAPTTAWGVVVDWSLEDATVTAVALADGTASLYLSTGGGVIGGQQTEPVRNAAMAIVRVVGATEQFTSSSPLTLPARHHVRIYALTASGLRVSPQVSEQALSDASHPLHPAFAAFQNLLTALREASGAGA